MRHNPNSAVYNGAYINERVRFDVLSAVLERPSADGVLRMLTHMSLMRDPRAPVHVPNDVLAALPPNQDIIALEQRRDELKAGAYRVQGTDVETEVRRLTTAIGSARSRHRNIISEEYRADYFRRRPTEDIERQNSGQEEEEYIEPVVEHQIPQRAKLADLLCTRLTDLPLLDAVKRRIQAADLMQSLCGCREVALRYRRRVVLPLIIKEESPAVIEPYPLICKKTQCIFFCDSMEKTFSRPSKMMEHVERHLCKEPGPTVACRHPVCKDAGLVLSSVNHFKYHVHAVHGITLRDPRFVCSAK